MADFVRFGSAEYWILLILLIIGRGLDFLSTWIATPNLVVEANPVARKLGWKFGIITSLVLSILIAAWPFPAIIWATTSLLVASRNFQSAWLMRTLGEHVFHQWMGECLARTPLKIYLGCTLAQSVIYACIGGALMFFSEMRLFPFAIGMGFFTFACAVAIYSTLSFWRFGRS